MKAELPDQTEQLAFNPFQYTLGEAGIYLLPIRKQKALALFDEEGIPNTLNSLLDILYNQTAV
jgi:hypothetical protein